MPNQPMKLPLLPSSTLWAIESTSLSTLLATLQSLPPEALSRLGDTEPALSLDQVRDTAIVSILGPLEKRASVFGQMLGMTSHTLIREALNLAVDDPGVRRIPLRVDGMAAPASFHAASQASKIYAGSMDLIGSIGTKLVLLDLSQAYDKAGIKPFVIAQPVELKAAGEPGTEISEGQREMFQSIVDQFFADFVKVVSPGRAITPSEVMEAAGRGEVVLAEESKRRGLTDDIEPFDDVLADIRQQAEDQHRRNVAAMDQMARDLAQLKTGQQLNKAKLPDRNGSARRAKYLEKLSRMFCKAA